ncbi:MAG: lasso peptide biosynthesis B2 protein [Anaerolineae bacterium]|nr:lasso peptide biosynthesis B2 protein [Anaerolineae bacterium]
MKQARTFLNLSPTEQQLLIKAALLLGLITLGLRAFSFQTLRRWLTGVARNSIALQDTNRPSPERVARVVQAAGRYVPGATCLPQALAVQTLLKQRGYSSSLRIGVAKGEGGQLEAHAWVESQGRIVIGNSNDLARYTLLPLLEGERQ